MGVWGGGGRGCDLDPIFLVISIGPPLGKYMEFGTGGGGRGDRGHAPRYLIPLLSSGPEAG